MMWRRAGIFCVLSASMAIAQSTRPASPPSAAAADAPATQPSKYIRLLDRGNTGSELDTADVTFTNGHGVTVQLVAAVHVAEPDYYGKLSRSFEDEDAVLYELVKSRDTAPPAGNGAGEHSDSFVGRLQLFLKSALGLDFQLDDIDYTRRNFVHADLDRETFEKMEADRGESIWTLMLQQALKQMDAQNPNGGNIVDEAEQWNQIVDLLCRPDAKRQLKLMLAREMDQLDLDASGMGGPEGSVLVTERNKAAMKALDEALAGGKKKIVIFYGAAHMPDMARRLETRGFTFSSTKWRTAWDLTIRPDQPSFIEELLRGMSN